MGAKVEPRRLIVGEATTITASLSIQEYWGAQLVASLVRSGKSVEAQRECETWVKRGITRIGRERRRAAALLLGLMPPRET